jgi:sterol desaturase/sphingolipid hydroxylase (fatty acid hydroxylase superfamily)
MQWLDAFTALGLEKVFLLLMGPVFALCMLLEARWLSRHEVGQPYTEEGTSANIALGLGQALADGFAWTVMAGLFYGVHEHRLMDIPVNFWTLLGLLLAQDLCHYGLHRAGHRVRWLWASHVTHHSSQTLNLSTALRHSPTHLLSGAWLFWLPLAWLGFQPGHVILCVGVSLAFQFFVHTQAIGRLPDLVEAVFNTPSHHRVHHARNPQYVDRNYGGIFIIWDRMFGTFVPEVEPCDYGIVRQVYTRSTLVMVSHEWVDLIRDICRAGPVEARLKHLWAPPEWQRPVTERSPSWSMTRLMAPATAQSDDAEDWPVHAGW